MTKDGLLKPKQVAAHLGICLETLRGHIRRREISVVRIGAGLKRPRLRLRPAAVAEFELRQSELGAGPCQFIVEERIPPTASTSSSVEGGLREIQAALAAEKRSGQKTSCASAPVATSKQSEPEPSSR